jgi:hypothetical protein
MQAMAAGDHPKSNAAGRLRKGTGARCDFTTPAGAYARFPTIDSSSRGTFFAFKLIGCQCCYHDETFKSGTRK